VDSEGYICVRGRGPRGAQNKVRVPPGLREKVRCLESQGEVTRLCVRLMAAGPDLSLDPLLSAALKRSLRYLCVGEGCIISIPPPTFWVNHLSLMVESAVFSVAAAYPVDSALLGVGCVTRSTLITLLPAIASNVAIMDGENTQISKELPTPTPTPSYSLSPVYDLIWSFANCAQSVQKILPRGVLLSGPPGVGKSYGVKQACMAAGVSLRCVNGSETSVESLRLAFESCTPPAVAVVFLDEIDALASRRSLLFGELLRLLDGERPGILVMAATNRPHALVPAIRRAGRLDREMTIPPPDEEERDAILQSLKVSKEQAKEVARITVGYVGADLAALVRESLFQRVSLTAAMERVGNPSALRHAAVVARPHGSWDDVGGGGPAKTALKRAVDWPIRYKAAFERFKLGRTGGVLLHGPPGCGKTSLVRATAASTGVAFVSFSCADIFSPYVGEAEAAVRAAFRLARGAAPALLFFDEIDALVGGGRGGGAESRVLATFLNEMDGVDIGDSSRVRVTVLAATNRLAAVDVALLRPGRFDTVIFIPPPTAGEKLEILQVHTRGMPLADDVDLSILARESPEGLTGAQVEGACREAAIAALRERMQDAWDVNASVAVAAHHLRRALVNAWSGS
jgi:SpoVK/Ycf46/Vps4 family AAA+-type ATPase